MGKINIKHEIAFISIMAKQNAFSFVFYKSTKKNVKVENDIIIICNN